MTTPRKIDGIELLVSLARRGPVDPATMRLALDTYGTQGLQTGLRRLVSDHARQDTEWTNQAYQQSLQDAEILRDKINFGY